MSTFDLNSNIESSLGDDDSVDSGRIKSIRDKFESTHDFTKPKKVPLGSSVNRLGEILLIYRFTEKCTISRNTPLSFHFDFLKFIQMGGKYAAAVFRGYLNF